MFVILALLMDLIFLKTFLSSKLYISISFPEIKQKPILIEKKLLSRDSSSLIIN
jgi:hypothetical protein